MADPSSMPDVSEATSSDPLDWSHLSPGERWHVHYEIGEQLPDQSMGKCFKAMHLENELEVIVRTFRTTDSVRGKTWEILRTMNGDLVECIEAFEHEGRRVEVCAAPPALSLREWGGIRKAGGVELRMIAQSLHRILSQLHEKGLVHLNLRPEKIFVVSMEEGLTLKVGGLESATLIEQEGLVTAVVHPYYAPPEAAGLYQHSAGRGLRAWDWWSVGRMLQEMSLGRHVLGHLLERDVTRHTPELLSRAESLLLEQDESGLRAGAVECMPSSDKELTLLFKGLLTSCRDARWGTRELKSWLSREPVKERYSLARNERLFVWKDRAFTVPEAAEYFGCAENWRDGVFNLWNPSDSTTLLYFLNEVPGMQKQKEKLDGYLKMKEGVALSSYPIEVKQDLIACVAWAHLGAGLAKPRIFGRELNAECLRELLNQDMLPNGLYYVRGLLARAMMQQFEQLDAAAARYLAEFDRVTTAALTVAKTNSWIVENNIIEVAHIMRLCLEPNLTLMRTLEEMRRRFACSRIIVLDRMFKKASPALPELALLAFTDVDPQRFEYVTHAEWMTEHCRILRERGSRLQVAISWLNLWRALRFGPLVFGNWRLSLSVWATFLVGIGLTQQWLMGGVAVLFPLLAVAACKLLWYRLNRRVIDPHLPEGESWDLMDGAPRAMEQALKALDVASAPAVRDLRKSFREINDEIVKLTIVPKPEKIVAPRRCFSTWMVAWASWLFTLGAFGGTVYTLVLHPPRLPKMVTSVISGRKSTDEPDRKNQKEQQGKGWTSAVTPNEAEQLERTAEVDQRDREELTAALAEVKRLREEQAKLPKPPPKIAWTFKPDPHPQLVRLRGAEEADSGQIQTASDVAAATLSRFDARTIDAVIAIRVPSEKGIGLMLWDARNGRLMNRSVMKINYVPLSRTWLDVGGKTVFFLGTN